ncbi:helix-hairpin-helix domain-containing protein [Halococcus sediminicola]|uniref:helix-hairpin-helix domain-containing protein n=1 Tax=Halococcus sediminicola TaxID=1264579 RepID=UPI0006787551|nr:helix-hairpin-helix domain-containing protein [Halococcus sediminicola]
MSDDATNPNSNSQQRGSDGGIEQPANETVPGRIARLPGVRSMPVIGAGRPTSGEDHIPLQDAVRGEYAIRRDDGTYIGVIEVEPANMATVDDSEWEAQVERLSSVLMSNTNGSVQIYSPMRSVDYGDRHETYSEQAQERHLTGDTTNSKALADIAQERAKNVSLHEQTTLSRTHYVIVSVSELDTTARFTEDRGGLATVPVVGSMVKQHEREQKDDAAHARAMCDKLTTRVEQMASAIRGMEGVSATPLSSTKATQVIDDHYGRGDAFAYDDYASLVRQAPLVYGDEDDPEYPIAHEHEQVEGDATGGRAVADDGAQARYQPGVSPPDRTTADVVRDEPDALADHYKSLLAAKFDTTDPGHVRIDDRTLTSTIAVRNWPRVPTYGMFSHILASSKPGVEVILSVQAERDETDDMDQKVLSLEQKWKKAEEKESFTRDRDRQKYETAKDINETRKAPNKAMFEVAAYITVKSDVTAAPSNEDRVEWHNDTVASVKRKLQEKPANAGGVRVDHNQMNGLHSSAPIAKDVIGETALMKDMGLASVYPWHAKNLTEPNGVVVGKHRERDEPTVLDIYNRPTGYNIGIFGTIGSGKTTSLKQLLTRRKLRNPETTIVVIDPLQDFAGLTKLFDGERIVIGGDTAINPFHIEPTPEDVLRDIGREIPFKTAVRQAKAFVETYYQLEGMNYENRKGTWEKAIKLAYKWAGITEDPDTHDRKSPTVMTAIWFIRDMARNPGNYVDDALENVESAKKNREQTAVEILNNDIEPLLEGGEYHNLTQQTDITDIENTGFLYLDLQQYDSDREAGGLMMQLLISQVYEQAKTSANPTVTAFDEAHYMFSNTADLRFLRQIVRHSRHYDLSMIFSTQQMGDFFEEREDEGETVKESAKDIIDNTSMTLFHYLKEMNSTWGKAFDLSEAEQKFIKDAEPGEREIGYAEALLQIDREGCFPLRVEMDEDVNPREFALYRYDPQKHGEDMAAYLRHHDDVCNWRWASESGFRPELADETEPDSEPSTQPAQSDEGDGTDDEREAGPSDPEATEGDERATGSIDDAERRADASGIRSAEEVIAQTGAADRKQSDKPTDELTLGDIHGTVDAPVAASLRDAGFESVEAVYGADNSALADVEGFDPTKAAWLQRNAARTLGWSEDLIEDPESAETNERQQQKDESSDENANGETKDGAQPALTDIKHIGEDRAATLREASFESVGDVASAECDELTVVGGVGPTRAEQLIESASDLLAEWPAKDKISAGESRSE